MATRWLLYTLFRVAIWPEIFVQFSSSIFTQHNCKFEWRQTIYVWWWPCDWLSWCSLLYVGWFYVDLTLIVLACTTRPYPNSHSSIGLYKTQLYCMVTMVDLIITPRLKRLKNRLKFIITKVYNLHTKPYNHPKAQKVKESTEGYHHQSLSTYKTL